MEILEAYDLTGSYRAAAELAGCDHHTVARYVALRDEGRPVERMRAERLADPFLAKIEEWVERSGAGSARTWPTASWPGWAMRLGADHPPGGRSGEAGLAGREPSGLPAVDSRAGPVVAVGLGRRATGGGPAEVVVVRVAGLVAVPGGLPASDRTLPSVLGLLDATLRRLGGVPTYALTDNEKTVTVEHVAGVAVRHPLIVAAGRHYGITVATCVPADHSPRAGRRPPCGWPSGTWSRPR